MIYFMRGLGAKMKWNKAALLNELDTRTQIKERLTDKDGGCCFLGAFGYSLGASHCEGGDYMSVEEDRICISFLIDKMPITLSMGFLIDDLLKLDLDENTRSLLVECREEEGSQYRVSLVAANDTYGITFPQFKQLIGEYCE